MSYSLLGNSCSPQTSAETSNRKFLLPDDPVYLSYYTSMMEYPGGRYPSGLMSVTGENDYPKTLHAYQGKFGAPHKSMSMKHVDPSHLVDKDTSKDTSKGTSKDTSKGTSKDTSKDTSNCTTCSSR
jgi:hypothetical protein